MLTNVSGVLEKHVTDVYSVSTFVSSIFCRFFCFSSSRWKHSPTIRFMTFVINWFRLVEIVKWKNYLSSGSLKWKDSLSPNSKLYSPNSDNPVPSHQWNYTETLDITERVSIDREILAITLKAWRYTRVTEGKARAFNVLTLKRGKQRWRPHNERIRKSSLL